MSVIDSSANLTPVGILRRTPSKSRVAPMAFRTPTKIGSPLSGSGVTFAAPENLVELLSKAATKQMDGAEAKKTSDELEGLLRHLRNARGDILIDWIKKIQKNVPVLKPKMEPFVLSLLKIGWADQSEEVGLVYKEFLEDLVTAQSYYTKPVMKMLLANLSGIADRAAFASSDGNASLDSVEELVFNNSHASIRAILAVVPLAGRNALLNYVRECLPYILTPDAVSHTNYVRNLLQIADYVGQTEDGGRIAILGVLTERLVQLDAQIDMKSKYSESNSEESQYVKKEISAVNESQTKKSNEIAKRNLDAALCVMFKYIEAKLKESMINLTSAHLYLDFLKCFESHVLPAKGTGHVQFIMFFLISSKEVYSNMFLKWLWNKFTSPNEPSILRQTVMAYIASFTSRATCVNKISLMDWLCRICEWIHAYIDQSDGAKSNVNGHAHGAFHAACQAVFYMFAFRHDEFKDSRAAVDILSKLDLQKIVACRLNPLQYCARAVVTNFSSIANYWQLAYCETVLQKNQRSHLRRAASSSAFMSSTNGIYPALLQSYFPFDPYMLTDSKVFIAPHYRQYKSNMFPDDEESSSDEDVISDKGSDDELSENENESLESDHLTLALDDNETFGTENCKRQRLSSSCKISSVNECIFGYSGYPGFKG